MNKLASSTIILIMACALQSCGTTINKQTADYSGKDTDIPKRAHTATKTDATALTPIEPINTQPLDPHNSFPINSLYSLLVAEVAASRKQYNTTLELYVEQATATKNLQIISRAARIAQFFRAKQESLDMGLMWLQQQPDNIEALTLVTNAYIELGEPLAAITHTEKLFTLFPADDYQDVSALVETIASASKQVDKKTVDELIMRYQQLNQHYPNQASIQVGLCILHQLQGNQEEAMEWVQQALDQDPKHTTAMIQEVLLLQKNKQNALATDKLKSYLEQDPSNNRLRLMYARLLMQTDINEAYEQFTQLSQQTPHQLDLKFSRAILATELKHLVVAKTLFDELLADHYHPSITHFYLGHIADANHEYNAALDHYLAVKKGDNVFAAQVRAGKILIRQGKIDAAGTLFTQLRNTFPKKREQTFVDESDLLLQFKQQDKAFNVLNKAIKEFPDSSSLRYNRSTIYEQQNKLALMESDLRHILTIDPNNVTALNGLGYFLAIRTERYQEAWELINKALKLNPQNAAIIDSMGWVVFKLGRTDEAIRYLQQAFDLFPDQEVAAHLGEALWSNGQIEKAKAIWKESLEANPNAPHITETLQRLNISL